MRDFRQGHKLRGENFYSYLQYKHSLGTSAIRIIHVKGTHQMETHEDYQRPEEKKISPDNVRIPSIKIMAPNCVSKTNSVP